jgi:hypothetical protein
VALSRRRQLLAAVGGTAVLAVLLTGCDLPIPPFDDGIPNCTVETVPTPFGPSHERFVDELGYRYSTMFGCQTGWNPLFRGEPIY